jgi:hypothetical protein
MVTGEAESLSPFFVVLAGILTQLSAEYPNDMELGAAIRKIAFELNSKFLKDESIKAS